MRVSAYQKAMGTLASIVVGKTTFQDYKRICQKIFKERERMSHQERVDVSKRLYEILRMFIDVGDMGVVLDSLRLNGEIGVFIGR